MSRIATAYAFRIGQEVLLTRLSGVRDSAPNFPYFGKVIARRSWRGAPFYTVRIKNAPKDLRGLRQDWLRATHSFGIGDRVMLGPSRHEKPTRRPGGGLDPVPEPQPANVVRAYMHRTPQHQKADAQDWNGLRYAIAYTVEMKNYPRPIANVYEYRLKPERAPS